MVRLAQIIGVAALLSHSVLAGESEPPVLFTLTLTIDD